MCVCVFAQSHFQEERGADEAHHLNKYMNIYAIDISVSAREHRLQIGRIQIRILAKCVCAERSVCVRDLCVGMVEDYRLGST